MHAHSSLLVHWVTGFCILPEIPPGRAEYSPAGSKEKTGGSLGKPGGGAGKAAEADRNFVSCDGNFVSCDGNFVSCDGNFVSSGGNFVSSGGSPAAAVAPASRARMVHAGIIFTIAACLLLSKVRGCSGAAHSTRAPQRSVLHAMHVGVRRFFSDFLSSTWPQRMAGQHEALRCGPL